MNTKFANLQVAYSKHQYNNYDRHTHIIDSPLRELCERQLCVSPCCRLRSAQWKGAFTTKVQIIASFI